MSNKKSLPVTHIVANGMSLVLSDILAMPDGDAKDKAIANYLKVKIQDVGTQYFKDVHEFAVFALEHAKQHSNNYQYMTALVNAVAAAKGARHATLIKWFETYSPASFANERFITGKNKDNSHWNIDAARAKPYYEKAEKVSEELTMEDILAICERLVKKSKSDKVAAVQQQKAAEIAALVEAKVIPVVKQAIAAFEPIDAEVVSEAA
jgi:hypothetical protein